MYVNQYIPRESPTGKKMKKNFHLLTSWAFSRSSAVTKLTPNFGTLCLIWWIATLGMSDVVRDTKLKWLSAITDSPIYVVDVWSGNLRIEGVLCHIWFWMSLLRQHLFRLMTPNILMDPWLCYTTLLTLKVLNFWKFTSYCSSKPLWSGMGVVVPARTSPTLHPPSPPTVHQLSGLAL